MTDEQINELAEQYTWHDGDSPRVDHLGFARAILAAPGAPAPTNAGKRTSSTAPASSHEIPDAGESANKAAPSGPQGARNAVANWGNARTETCGCAHPIGAPAPVAVTPELLRKRVKQLAEWYADDEGDRFNAGMDELVRLLAAPVSPAPAEELMEQPEQPWKPLAERWSVLPGRDEMVFVPREPTEAMLAAAACVSHDDTPTGGGGHTFRRNIAAKEFRAMVAAAPLSPSQVPQGQDSGAETSEGGTSHE